MENCDNAEGKWENVVPHMESGDYTIEHIMPQTLSAAWRQDLSGTYRTSESVIQTLSQAMAYDYHYIQAGGERHRQGCIR